MIITEIREAIETGDVSLIQLPDSVITLDHHGLSMAGHRDNLDVFKLLIQSYTIKQLDRIGILSNLLMEECHDAVRVLLDYGMVPSSELVNELAQNNDGDNLLFLLENGLDTSDSTILNNYLPAHILAKALENGADPELLGHTPFLESHHITSIRVYIEYSLTKNYRYGSDNLVNYIIFMNPVYSNIPNSLELYGCDVYVSDVVNYRHEYILEMISKISIKKKSNH